MELQLIAHIENFGEAGYIGYIDSIKGMVVQGTTIEETCNQLMISLKVKMAHDFGVKIPEEKENHFVANSRLFQFEKVGTKKLNLVLQQC